MISKEWRIFIMTEKNIKDLLEIVGSDNCMENEPMKKHTTFRIGGAAKLFVVPQSVDVLKKVLSYCKEQNVKTFILGNGSNLLVSDKGFDGVIIQIYRNMNKIIRDGNSFRIEAGALLSSISAKACEAGLSGFEFASGIPGTLGGAVVMNAGAYGGEMSQVVTEVTLLNDNLEVEVLGKEQLEFGYRKSVVSKKGAVVLEAVITLQEGNVEDIKACMDELRAKRKEKQPLEFPSAGSTFKRPEGNFAGKLIMDAGFRGYSVGGAQVSEKHCGFVINKGNATAEDVIELTNRIKEKILNDNNILLELEVKLLGEFEDGAK